MSSGSKKCACGRPISANALYCAGCTAKIPPAPTGGVLEILNVQGGDVKITFDQQNVSDAIRARRIVTDMLRRGYALVVEIERNGEKAYERIQGFDEARGEYIVADFDAMAAHESDMDDAADRLRKVAEQEDRLRELNRRAAAYPPEEAAPKMDEEEPAATEKKKQGRPSTRMPMESTKATAVGRSAGGD
jgi:hypothetical protein